MNDLERDLKNLFDDKARDVDAATLAPPSVLARGRRRQARTVLVGGLASIAVVAIAVAGVSSALGRRSEIPAGTPDSGYAERTAEIQGITVTAPAGWTLVDQWPLAQWVATESTMCSFTETGVPVGGDGTATSVTQPSPDDCVTTKEDLPGGLPVFMLSNFEPDLMETACGLPSGDPRGKADITGDRALLAMNMDVSLSPQQTAFLPPWQVALDFRTPPTDGPCGSGWYGQFQAGGNAYAMFAAFGPEATDADRQAVSNALSGLQFLGSGTPVPLANGPGYVLAADVASRDTAKWRLEAGLVPPTDEKSTFTVGATVVIGGYTASDSYGDAGAWTVSLPSDGAIVADSVNLGGGTTLTWGTAAPTVTGVSIDLDDGRSFIATMSDWPSATQGYVSDATVLNGSLWYALTDQPGQPVATLSDGSTSTGGVGQISESPAPTGSPGTLDATALDYRTEGSMLVATGTDLGTVWEIRIDDVGLITLTAAGRQSGISLTTGGTLHEDVPGGTFLIGVERPSTGSVSVTSDTGDVYVGRWMPIVAVGGGGTRMWLTILPGSGAGLVHAGDGLPYAISWPTTTRPLEGALLMGGGDGTVSWALRLQSPGDPACLVVDVVAAIGADTGTSSCLVPADPVQYPDGVSFVGGVYGQTVATIAVVGPSGMTVHGTADGSEIFPMCEDVAGLGRAWGGSEVCVVPIPVGASVALRTVDKDGNPLGRPIALGASPGELMVGDASPPSP